MDFKDFKEFKKFCIDLRCPICNSQLDGNIQSKRADLYCVSDNSEYKCTLFSDSEYCFEKIIIRYYPNQYVITSRFFIDNSESYTTIHCENLELNEKFRVMMAGTLLSQGGKYHKLTKTKSEAELLQKIKLYSTFG